MNLSLLANALGIGIERAAQLSYADAREMLGHEGISEPVQDEASADWVNLEIRAVQALTDLSGECIELVVLANDGRKELQAYFYARPNIPDAS